jgi:hypothetical protein
MFAGYFSARLYKTLNGQKWKRAALVTGTLYPGVVATLAFILNFFIWGKHSSGAVGYHWQDNLHFKTVINKLFLSLSSSSHSPPCWRYSCFGLEYHYLWCSWDITLVIENT